MSNPGKRCQTTEDLPTVHLASDAYPAAHVHYAQRRLVYLMDIWAFRCGLELAGVVAAIDAG